MKKTLALGGLILASASWGQISDAKFKADLTLNIFNQARTDQLGVFYSPLGRYSTFGLEFATEPGFQLYLSQRLQRLPNDADNELFDEYYAEDAGYWRVGKQYLPFGNGTLFRETARAARGDTNLVIEGVPIAIAFVDNGENRQKGFVGRFGGRSLGFSFAVGRNFGINGTALTTIRSVSDSPGVGSGWRQAWGADLNRRFGLWNFKGEMVVLREPEADPLVAMTVLDGSVEYQAARRVTLMMGASAILNRNDAFYRVSAKYNGAEGIDFEAMLRSNNYRFVDLSLMVRVRF